MLFTGHENSFICLLRHSFVPSTDFVTTARRDLTRQVPTSLLDARISCRESRPPELSMRTSSFLCLVVAAPPSFCGAAFNYPLTIGYNARSGMSTVGHCRAGAAHLTPISTLHGRAFRRKRRNGKAARAERRYLNVEIGWGWA